MNGEREIGFEPARSVFEEMRLAEVVLAVGLLATKGPSVQEPNPVERRSLKG
jgi:hypothetical protein